MSAWLIRFLILEYVVVVGVCLYERRYLWALYWGGSVILTIAVLMMGERGRA